VYGALSKTPNLVVPWEPDLSIVAFHPADGDNGSASRLLERINDSKRIFISDTVVDGRSILRVCILSHRTHRDRIEEGIEIIQKAAADL
jgi:aromatic-L-amino-acid decarboxylase